MVAVVTANEDGKIELTKEELERLIEKSRKEGYTEGYSSGYSSGYNSGCNSKYNYGWHWNNTDWYKYQNPYTTANYDNLEKATTVTTISNGTGKQEFNYKEYAEKLKEKNKERKLNKEDYF